MRSQGHAQLDNKAYVKRAQHHEPRNQAVLRRCQALTIEEVVIVRNAIQAVPAIEPKARLRAKRNLQIQGGVSLISCAALLAGKQDAKFVLTLDVRTHRVKAQALTAPKAVQVLDRRSCLVDGNSGEHGEVCDNKHLQAVQAEDLRTQKMVT